MALNSISVTPLVGEFSDVECGKLFVIPFTVRNISSRVCRIRCVPPKSKCFRLLSTQQTIAPGMRQTIELEFSSATAGEVLDELVIRCDEGDVKIPLHAWFPTPNLQFNPNVDFGEVSANHPVESKKLKLRNTGRKDGVFRFVVDGPSNGVTITPNQGIVPAGRDIDVAVHLFPTEVGPVRSAFTLQVEGQTTSKLLSVRATVIEARVLVVRPGTMEPVSQLNFGRLYYGQRREVQLLVQNTGQSCVSYSISPPDADVEEDHIAAPFPIQVFPREGRIASNGTAMLTVKFAPQMLEQKQGWAHAAVDEKGLTRQWDLTFEIDVLETEQKLEMQLSGTAVPIIVKASEKLCSFGECPANDYLDIMVTLENQNSDLPAVFEFNRIAQFTTTPSRGHIAPKGSTDVKITFQPRQLGTFEGQFNVSLNGGIKKLPIMVSGTSTTMAPKPARPGGTKAVAEDFVRPLKLVKDRPKTNKAPVDPLAAMPETNVLLRPEHEQKQQHNKLYNQYLTNSRLIREVKTDARHKMPENPDDMGMVPAEGLVPPEPEIPAGTDRFPWPADGGKGMQMDHPAVHKIKIDENKLVKKKFRKDPSNLNELRECKLVLSPKEIQNVIIPVKLIDFQRVNVFSVNKKPFFVHNGLKTHIHVAIAFSREELSQSTPGAQVVPPGQTAGFDITFRSEIAQTFQQAIYFTINDAHKLKFVVFAEAAPVELAMSTDELTFRFPDFGHDPSVVQTVTVTNPGNSDANFTWTLPPTETAFVFNPPSGVVPPGGTLPIAVAYTPPLSINESKAEAQLRVTGGLEPKRLMLSGSVPAASCTWSLKDGKVDFKKISVGAVRSQTITIKNTGSVATVFAFDTAQLLPGITLSQSRGRVAPNSSEDVIVTLKTSVPQNLKCALNCHIRGMRQLLKSFILAESKVPDLAVIEPVEVMDDDEAALDFGGVYVGSSEYRRMIIQNHDDIVSSLLIDLSQLPQFTLVDVDKRAVQDVLHGEDTDVQVPGAGALHVVKTEYDEQLSEEEDHGFLYRLTINPKETLIFFLVFTPTEITPEQSFPLPLTLAGCDVVTEGLRPITVAAGGKRPKLVISPTVVDFGARVVVRDGTSKIPNRILVKLSNETDNVLSWELDGRSDSSDVFRIEPTSSKLLPGQGSQLQVTFIPTEIRSYSARYGVYLDGDKESRYMDIQAKGFGANPGLLFDRKEVILPPVPLDTLSVGTFYIGNDGYESLELKYRIAGEGKLPIQLKFPEGNVITSTTSMVPVEVHFISKKPMTFTINIDFYDEADGGLFAIPVTCTADNSLLTTAGYVKYVEGRSTLTADGERKPVMFRDQTKEHLKNEPTTDDEVGPFQLIDTVLKKTITRKELDRIRQWLNSNVLPDPVEDLIGSLQLNQGKLLVDIIEMLFGKVPQLPKSPAAVAAAAANQGNSNNNKSNMGPSSANNATNNNANDSAGQSSPREGVYAIIDAFDSVLLFLKQYGACVSEVRSEYLMRYEDYQRATPPAEPTVVRSGHKGRGQRTSRISERRFLQRCLHAWLLVLTQTIRVFFLSRISWKTLRASPPTPATSAFSSYEKWSTNADPSCIGSNVYSQGEAVLLKWLSVHMSYFFPKKDTSPSSNRSREFDVERDRVRLVNFDSNLRDCRAYAAVVMAYIPGSVARLDPTKDFGIIPNPATDDDLERNATLLLDTLQEYGLDPRITPHELTESSAMDNVLFSAFLFNSLPQYVPKTTVKFRGKLLDKITKQIELTNPTKWPIDYTVNLDGCDEFKLSDTKIHLDPKASTMVSISIRPRFAKRVDALCMFLSNRGSATMVFNLETEIDADSAMKTFDGIESPLYDALNYDVMVDNPFPHAAQFSVLIHQEYVKQEGKSYPEEESLLHFPDAFWSPIDTLNIKKNDKAKFTLQFLPCVRGTYKARVVFRDDRIGEFAFKFIATGLPPRPYESVQLQTEAATPVSCEVQIPLRHAALERALGQRVERLKGLKNAAKKSAANKENEGEGRETLYKVEFLSDKFIGPNPFFSGPKTFFVTKVANNKDNEENGPEKTSPTTSNPPKGTNSKAKGAAAQGQSMPVHFNPKTPGTYNCLMLLVSPWDIRVVAIEGKSRSPGLKAELEFNCPARQQIVQDIPITNGSENEWVIAATLQGEYFAGPRELRIPAGKTKSYALTFNPTWVCDVQGQLVLKNNDTQEKYTYTLKGRAEEPLAENTIPVECMAREFRKVVVTVPNITFDDVTYQVVTDLPFVSGDTSLSVAKMDAGKYTLNINPQLNGKVTGSLSFVAPNKQFVWYVIQVTATRPPPEDTISISTEVRSGAVAEITIKNPKDKSVDFVVRRRGDGLFGEDILTIEPKESAVYQLAYAPTRAGESEGTVSFNNDDIGEFWYKLKLSAKDAAPSDLSFQCEIGKTTSTEITLQNPLDVDCNISVHSTNDINYSVSPANLLMRPGGQLRAVVTYTPSAIQVSQESTITLSHPKAGVWVYRCRGTGLPPTKMDPVRCVGQVNSAASTSVTFRNPFPVPRKFSTFLQGDTTVFTLMMPKKQSGVVLGPFQHLQVPLSYTPTEITEHFCTALIEAVDQTEGSALRWEFPIHGIAECFSTAGATRFSCKARKKTVTVIPFTLPHLRSTLAEEVLVPDIAIDSSAKYYKAASSSITVRTVPPPDDLQSPPAENTVYCEFTFAPLRPFTVAAEMLLKRRGGGMWRFPLSLDSQPPEVDDVLELEAAVNVVASATFQLYNVLPQPRPYLAYFTPDSPQEFTVTPAKGTLPPMPRGGDAPAQGAPLTVNFASMQYGKTLVGMLVVDTEEMQWRYEVHGSLPKYKPPTNVTSRVMEEIGLGKSTNAAPAGAAAVAVAANTGGKGSRANNSNATTDAQRKVRTART